MTLLQGPIVSSVVDGQHIITLARPIAPDGTTILRANVTDWTLSVYRRGPGGITSPEATIYSVAATTAAATAHASEVDAFNHDSTAALFTALQTDGFWQNEDALGYSFRHRLKYEKISGSMEGADALLLEYSLNTVSHGNLPFRHEVTVLPARIR